MVNRIYWTLNSSEQVAGGEKWSNVDISNRSDYYITSPTVYGFNFLFLMIPNNKSCQVYNMINLLLFDSRLPSNNQLFEKINEINGYSVFKKKDVYNTYNPVTFKIKLI